MAITGFTMTGTPLNTAKTGTLSMQNVSNQPIYVFEKATAPTVGTDAALIIPAYGELMQLTYTNNVWLFGDPIASDQRDGSHVIVHE